MSKELYTPKDVQIVREQLLREQGGVDPITGLLIPPKQAVCDHDYKTQYVRGILHRQTNSVLGRIENMWTRYLKWWYTGTLPDFLRGCADYLEKEQPREYVHPAWIKKVQTQFNGLSESDKTLVLSKLGREGKNSVARKEQFKKAILTREFTFDTIQEHFRRIETNADKS